MKQRLLLGLALLVIVGTLTGCGGVTTDATYSRLLEETAAWANEVAERAEAGQLDPNQMARALRISADHWRRFQDARDGRELEDGR